MFRLLTSEKPVFSKLRIVAIIHITIWFQVSSDAQLILAKASPIIKVFLRFSAEFIHEPGERLRMTALPAYIRKADLGVSF